MKKRLWFAPLMALFLCLPLALPAPSWATAKYFGSRSAVTVATMADLIGQEGSASIQATRELLGFYAAGDGGGGPFYWDSTQAKTGHNGGTIIDPDHSVTPGAAGWWTAENATDGCWVRNTTSEDVMAWGGLAGAVEGIGTDERTVIVSDTQTISADLDVATDAPDLTLKFARNGLISVNTGITLTLPSPANIQAAPNQKIFSLTGTGAVTFGDRGDINALWWYAGTDLGPALTSAVASAYSDFASSQIIVPTGTYDILTSVDVADYGNLRYSTFDFNNSRIFLKTNGTPAFDCTGTAMLRFKNGYIESEATLSASSAILFSTTAASTHDHTNWLDNITIAGKYTKATIVAICIAPLIFEGSVILTNSTPGVVLSLTRRNSRSEASVYSTIATAQDNISFWSGPRMSATGGGSGAASTTPILEFEGAHNHISINDPFMRTSGGPYIEFDVTTETMDRYAFLRQFRTEYATAPGVGIKVTGANSIGLDIQGGTIQAATTTGLLLSAPDATVNLMVPDKIVSNSRRVSLHTLFYGRLDLSNFQAVTITDSITNALEAYIANATNIANLTVPAASEHKVHWVDYSGSRSFVHVRRATSGISCTTGNAVVVNLNTEYEDTYSEFNTTTNKFTAKKHGFYQVSANLTLTVTAADLISVYIRLSGTSNPALVTKRAGGTTESLHISAVVEMDKDDYIELYYINETNNSTIENSPTNGTYMTIASLG